MADKILKSITLAGQVILPVEDEQEMWIPAIVSNDFYPKIITEITNASLKSSLFEFYEQKSEFLNLEIPKTKMLIEPIVAGWGITFENITVFFNGEKFVIYNPVIQDKGITFEDTFYRFSSMYTFNDKVNATSEEKIPYLKKSWKYKK
jgi:hypothetical protein